MTNQQYIVKLESALSDAVDLLRDMSNFLGHDLKYADRQRLVERTAEVLDKAAKVRQ